MITKFLSLLLYYTLLNTEVSSGEIAVKIQNIKSDKGVFIIALFENEESFLKKSFRSKVVPLDAAQKPVVFKNLPKGKYAVSIIHDENENGKLDTNWAGIPKEPFGFSKKTMGRFGPPNFEDTCIEVSNGSSETIVKMRALF